ncbi:MAG: fructosamine kinase family protein [Bacteroidales bacterium]|nr:fructosamine kinase family protein [Bacteroidales bacterium]
MLPKELEFAFLRMMTGRGLADIQIIKYEAIGGGSINEAIKVYSNRGNFFIKYNKSKKYPGMFEKEAKGLKILKETENILIPEIYGYEELEAYSFLVLEFIERGIQSITFQEDFGKQLALLHQNKSARYGLDHNNYIGSLKQDNHWENNWQDFFILRRLEPLLRLASDNGLTERKLIRQFESFYQLIPEIFPDEGACLIHGDLWNGNYIINQEGKTCLIDPAVYYGHREMDIGMSKLFGGFHNEFYEAYNATWPLEKHWHERIDYCNLYPLLVHLKLFGKGYYSTIARIMEKF